MRSSISSGVLLISSMLSDTKRFAVSGERSSSPTTLFSRLMTTRGVPAGTAMPSHVDMSKPATPDSATVGRSGIAWVRRAPDDARPRSLPERMCGNVDEPSNITCTCPESRSAMACDVPL
jgi:hypothetical protein